MEFIDVMCDHLEIVNKEITFLLFHKPCLLLPFKELIIIEALMPNHAYMY